MKAQKRRGDRDKGTKWEKASQKVGARAIKDTGKADINVNTWKLQDQITGSCSLCLPWDQRKKQEQNPHGVTYMCRHRWQDWSLADVKLAGGQGWWHNTSYCKMKPSRSDFHFNIMLQGKKGSSLPTPGLLSILLHNGACLVIGGTHKEGRRHWKTKPVWKHQSSVEMWGFLMGRGWLCLHVRLKEKWWHCWCLSNSLTAVFYGFVSILNASISL